MDDKQQNFYKRLLINIRVKCLKQGIEKSEFCLKQGRKISDICLKQGQGMRGHAAPPHPGIFRVPPTPPQSRPPLYHPLTMGLKPNNHKGKSIYVSSLQINSSTLPYPGRAVTRHAFSNTYPNSTAFHHFAVEFLNPSNLDVNSSFSLLPYS